MTLIKDKKKYIDTLSNFTFEEYFSSTDSEIKGLRFNRELEIFLKNKLIYSIALAKRKDDYFVKVSASVDETLSKEVVIRNKNLKEDIENAGSILKVQGTAKAFNKKASHWVYKIYKSSYEGLI